MRVILADDQRDVRLCNAADVGGEAWYQRGGRSKQFQRIIEANKIRWPGFDNAGLGVTGYQT